MMKKTLLLIIFILSKTVSAQVVLQEANSKEMKKFLTSKTMFVLKGNKDFDDHLKSAVTKYWKVTSYDFISKNEVESRIDDETLSFLTDIDYVRLTEGPSRPGHNDFASRGQNRDVTTKYSLVCGGRKSLDKYKYWEKSEIAYITFDGFTLEKKDIDAGPRLDFIVKGLNDGIDAVSKNGIKGSEEKVATSVYEHFSENASLLKQKTLLIEKDYTTDRGPHLGQAIDLKEFDKHRIHYEIKPHEEIIEILKKGDSQYCYFFSMMALVYIYDVETKSTIYANMEMRELTFGKKSIEKLLAKMEGGK